VLKFYKFISTALVLVVLAGGSPSTACTPAVCAADAQCASLHCSCCGPNCPWSKKSQESKKRDSSCNDRCPLVAGTKPAAINNAQSLVSATLNTSYVQPLMVPYVALRPAPIHPTFNFHSPTLLSLACALTV
jgi:hypothetical protein